MTESRIERIGDATLYLGDCYAILPGLTVESVVTDPPYGIDWMPRVRNQKAIAGDGEPFDPAPILVGKQHILFGANHYASRLPDGSRWLCWLKHDPGLFGKRGYSPFELAWTDLGGSCQAIKHIWDGWIKQGESFNTHQVHPAQKPVEVMQWCVAMTEGVVCDPFMGSGTTGVACALMGRPFVGIELDAQYFDIACERIAAANKQQRLFA